MIEKNERPYEERLTEVTDWVEKIGRDGKVDDIEPQLVMSVLEGIGANFEIDEEEKASLKKFKNINRRPGMDAVWGKERVDGYKKWLKDWVVDFEERTSRQLPVLQGTNTKTSGGFNFFTDLTVFAADLMPFEKYKTLTERRVEKGKIWQERDLSKPHTPSSYSSFPPEFPMKALDFLITSKP